MEQAKKSREEIRKSFVNFSRRDSLFGGNFGESEYRELKNKVQIHINNFCNNGRKSSQDEKQFWLDFIDKYHPENITSMTPSQHQQFVSNAYETLREKIAQFNQQEEENRVQPFDWDSIIYTEK